MLATLQHLHARLQWLLARHSAAAVGRGDRVSSLQDTHTQRNKITPNPKLLTNPEIDSVHETPALRNRDTVGAGKAEADVALAPFLIRQRAGGCSVGGVSTGCWAGRRLGVVVTVGATRQRCNRARMFYV